MQCGELFVVLVALLVMMMMIMVVASPNAPPAPPPPPPLDRLLRVFGFERPGRRARHVATPQYMLDLYDTIADRTTGVTRHANPYSADVVRSFHYTDSPNDLNHFKFELLNAIGHDERILVSEFHVYKLKSRNLSGIKNRKDARAHLLEMRVYQVMDPLLANQEEGNRLLDARRISAYSPGWEVFRVTDAVKDWLRNATSNYGLLLTLRSLIGEKLDPSVLRVMKRKHANGRQPILVVFTSRPNSITHPINIDSQSSFNPITDSDNSSRVRRSSDKISECSRHNLYVDFETIGWSGWIISPKGYNAYYCAGQCTYPLGQNQRPTNHATVQSIVHEMGLHSGGVTAPCCVPNKLLAISLLFFDENENVILKQYDGMVAAVCGCH